MINIFAYPGESPDFQKGTTLGLGHPAGLIMFTGDYIHWRDIEISYHTQENDKVWNGIRATSNNCIYENFNVHHCGCGFGLIGSNVGGTGQSDGNLILNGDFHHNYDPLTGSPYGNSDGLQLAYINAGCENKAIGCRSWSNGDDGLDLWNNDGSVYLNKCWAWKNGFREDGTTAGGNGAGFKLGSLTLDLPNLILRTLTNCLSFENRMGGFLDNGSSCNMVLYNNVAYANGRDAGSWMGGFRFNLGTPGMPPYYLKNNISYYNLNGDAYIDDYTNVNNNTWDGAVTVSDADFESLDSTGMDGARDACNNLPELNFLKLAEGSDLIAAGINVGVTLDGEGNPWNDPPSMGAYEYVSPTPTIFNPYLTYLGYPIFFNGNLLYV